MLIESDKVLNQELQCEVSSIRGCMASQILKETSDRYSLRFSETSPECIITDSLTGKSSNVPMFASKDVMRVLNKFKPETMGILHMCNCNSGKNGFERSDISRLREVCQQLSDKKPSVEYVCCLIAEANEVHMQEEDACRAFRALSDLNRLVLGLRYSEFLVPCGIYSENTTISMRGYLREEFLGMLGFSFATLMEVLKTLGLE